MAENISVVCKKSESDDGVLDEVKIQSGSETPEVITVVCKDVAPASNEPKKQTVDEPVNEIIEAPEPDQVSVDSQTRANMESLRRIIEKMKNQEHKGVTGTSSYESPKCSRGDIILGVMTFVVAALLLGLFILVMHMR